MVVTARDLKFDLDDTIASCWSPQEPEFSHVANAFMAALPHLEPYFIQTIREALTSITNESVVQDARGFIEQEARQPSQHADPPLIRAWLAQYQEGRDLRRLSTTLLDLLSGSASRAA